MIEVEKRAVLDRAKYQSMGNALIAQGAVDDGSNDTESVFYVEKDWQLKVQHLVSQQKAKIAWKSGGLDGAAVRKEVEILIHPEDFDSAKEVIAAIASSADVYPTSQKRHDYILDGISIAVKYSDDWGYHMELDMVVENERQATVALSRITELAGRLGVQLLTPDEEQAVINKALLRRQEAS